MATALEALPCIAAAFLDGTLSWTATRLVTGIATPRDEAGWIERARSMDARALEVLVRQARAPQRPSGDSASCEDAAESDRDDPRVRWTVRVSSLGWRMWRAAHELAERTAGSKLTLARVLELVAAEASGSVPPSTGVDPPASSDPAIRDLLHKLRSAESPRSAVADPGSGETGSGDAGNSHAHAGQVGEGRSSRPGYGWREGLETRDPELAAFLAEIERENAAAHGCPDSNREHDERIPSRPAGRQESSAASGSGASTSEHRPYDWREGLAERDPQLSAFLANCEAEAAIHEHVGAATPNASTATQEHASAATQEHGSAAIQEHASTATQEHVSTATPKHASTATHEHASTSTQERADAAMQERSDAAAEAADPPPNAPVSFASILAEVAAREGFPWVVPPVPADATGPSAWFERRMHALESNDPFVIDERLREVRYRAERIDFDLASLLREAARVRLYRDFGFENLEQYVESRLGICPRTAWTLLAIERACSRTSPRLADAWRGGRISTMAAHAILRVLGHGHDDDWIARARAVTLRRLVAEVDWARARLAEADTGEPPPEGLDLAGARLAGVTIEELQMRAHGAQPGEATAQPGSAVTDELQMRAHETAERKDAAADGPSFVPSERIAFFAPTSVCALATETMLALRVDSEPRGRAFERMLALAMLEWMAAPRHRDPVFERDGWCCAVPGCTSRRNLHDHHIVFRSHGGDNTRDNRVTVCAAHHLHGLHRGRIRAYGCAPGEVAWEIGIRFGPGHGGKPLFRTVGDRYRRPD